MFQLFPIDNMIFLLEMPLKILLLLVLLLFLEMVQEVEMDVAQVMIFVQK